MFLANNASSYELKFLGSGSLLIYTTNRLTPPSDRSKLISFSSTSHWDVELYKSANQAQVDIYNNRLRMVTDQSQDTFKVGKNLRLALDSLDKSYLRYFVYLSWIRRLYSNRPRLGILIYIYLL